MSILRKTAWLFIGFMFSILLTMIVINAVNIVILHDDYKTRLYIAGKFIVESQAQRSALSMGLSEFSANDIENEMVDYLDSTLKDDGYSRVVNGTKAIYTKNGDEHAIKLTAYVESFPAIQKIKLHFDMTVPTTVVYLPDVFIPMEKEFTLKTGARRQGDSVTRLPTPASGGGSQPQPVPRGGQPVPSGNQPVPVG